MNQRPDDLPDFENPPVIETVLGVQFAPLEKLQATHLGQIWELFKSEFPFSVDQPPLEPAFETFGGVRGSKRMRLELVGAPLLPRVWFVNSNKENEGNKLIQFQQDRFVHNWRKVPDRGDYPRYEPIKEKFIGDLHKLEEFIRVKGIGLIEVNQWEVSYINHIIPSEEDEDLLSDLGSVFSFWMEEEPVTGLGKYDTARFSMRFLIRSGDEPIGRLHITAEPGQLHDGREIVVLTMMARGQPHTPVIDDIEKFFDLGRREIVKGFADITTQKMHDRWGRKK